MSELVLNVEARKELGKQSAKKLRRDGRIPGIYYIHGEDSVPFTINEKDLHTAIHTDASILDLKFDDGKATKCVIRDIQWHPISDRPVHVDFMGIKMTEKVQVDLTLHIAGPAIGEKRDGGVMQQVIREISIEALPGDIPEHVEIDITAMEIGDVFRVEDLDLEGDVKILNEPNQTIVVIRPPRVIEEELEVAEEEPTEPDLVGEEKDEAEEEEGESS